MASRPINGSIQMALKELLAEKAVIEDAIKKLESLLKNIKTGVSTQRRRHIPIKALSAATSSKPARASQKKTAASVRKKKRVSKALALQRTQAAPHAAGAGRSPKPRAPRASKTPPRHSKSAASRTSRGGWSPEAREAAAARMRRYWAQQRKGLQA